MTGFGLGVLEPPEPLVARCGECRLYKGCASPKMSVDGKGRKRILLIGEAPGTNEDEVGRPFVGKAGQRLWRTLDKLSVERNNCWITNSIRCRPPGNRAPTHKELTYCRPFLTSALRDLKPQVIVPLGKSALASLLQPLWSENLKEIGRWVGWAIPCVDLNAWIVPNWHPSYLLRENDPVLDLFFEKYLKRAVEKKCRPWETLPDHRKQVRVIHSPTEAAERVNAIIKAGKLTAFDYETNMLKPDSAEASIFSCSLSNGDETISYPWHGAAAAATKDFLRSDVPKVAHNTKFEIRWSRKRLGINVRYLVWDTMLAAHILDYRKGVTSLKFQSFVRLGVSSYDGRVKKYLKEEGGGGNELNRIREADLREVLLYNGLDAVLELELAKIQMKEIGT